MEVGQKLVVVVVVVRRDDDNGDDDDNFSKCQILIYHGTLLVYLSTLSEPKA